MTKQAAKGTRSSPAHPLFGTPRALIVASKHPKQDESTENALRPVPDSDN